MLRHKKNKPRNRYKNCRNAASVQLHLTQLQVGCLLLNVQFIKNFGMRYERDMKSAFTKIDHAGSNVNNHF